MGSAHPPSVSGVESQRRSKCLRGAGGAGSIYSLVLVKAISGIATYPCTLFLRAASGRCGGTGYRQLPESCEERGGCKYLLVPALRASARRSAQE